MDQEPYIADHPPRYPDRLIDAIRWRPQMYVGATDGWGCLHVVAEMIHACLDEFIAGQGTLIRVTQTRDGWTEVSDDGEGVRVDTPPEFGGRTFLEVALTELWARGFRSSKCDFQIMAIAVASGAEFHIETHREGRCYRMEFTQGAISRPFEDRGPSTGRGTVMRWRPDPTIFGLHTVDVILLRRDLDVMAAVHPGLRILFTDEARGESSTILFPGGCVDLLRSRDVAQAALYPAISMQIECGDVQFDVAFLHSNTRESRLRSYVNGGPTEGGSHVRGFLTGAASCLREVGANTKFLSDAETFTLGLTAELSVVCENAQYEGPTRSVLHSPKIESFIAQQVHERLRVLLTEHPTLRDEMLSHLAKMQRVS